MYAKCTQKKPKRQGGGGGVRPLLVGSSWIISNLSIIYFINKWTLHPLPLGYTKHNSFCDITFYMYVIFLKYKIVWYIHVPSGFFNPFFSFFFNYQEVIFNENIELKSYIGIKYWIHRSVFQNFNYLIIHQTINTCTNETSKRSLWTTM